MTGAREKAHGIGYTIREYHLAAHVLNSYNSCGADIARPLIHCTTGTDIPTIESEFCIAPAIG
jgi:hypothetical protein